MFGLKQLKLEMAHWFTVSAYQYGSVFGFNIPSFAFLQFHGLSMSLSWLSGPSGSGGTTSSPPSVINCGETPST